MRDLTQEIPKPMLEVQGKPILQWIIEGLKEAGVSGFTIVTGWHAEVIEAYFKDGAEFGVEVNYVLQEVQDGTGKAPELAKPTLGEEPFILTYGDIMVRPEVYKNLIRRFQDTAAQGVMTVTPSEDVTQGGLCFFDQEFFLSRLVEKPSTAEIEKLRETDWLKPGEPVWYNAGIYAFTPELFQYTEVLEKSPRGEYELTDAISAMIDAGRRMAGLEIEGRWVDVRDPEVLESLQGDAL